MAEQSKKLNKISDYDGLEVLCNLHLEQLKYKSDLIILFAHHILTEQGFDCVEQENDPDNGYEPATYKVLDSIPDNWNKFPDRYKLFYKKGDKVKIVTGTKRDDSFVLFVLKEDYSRDQISSSLSLKLYIPDEFFDESHSRYKDLESITNLSDVMNLLTATISGNPKYGYKKLHDDGLCEHNMTRTHLVKAKIVPTVLDDEGQSSILSQIRCPSIEKEVKIGEFRLQDPNRHNPTGETFNDDFDDQIKFRFQEDLDGEPTYSFYT